MIENASDTGKGGMGDTVPGNEANRVSAARLFGERTELIVEHNGEEYRLRITSKGKLILTK